jgi:signal transduction histidine kinase
MPDESRKPQHSVLSKFVLESLPEPVLIVDPSGALIEANRCARQSLTAETFELFRAEPRSALVDAFFATLASSGRASIEIERPAAGAVTSQQLSIDGFAVERRYVVRVRDVTEQRRLERELTELEMMASRAAIMVRHAHLFTHSRRPQPAALDLNEIILGMRSLIERLFATSMKLEFSLADAVGAVRVDRSRLEHALLNLLVNARNALPGAGHVTISTRLVPTEPDAARFVSLSVSDTGSGMTEEVRARAFDDFYTTSAAAGGTGLGLASVRRFARESGGTVTLDSAPARGTTVTVLLPRVEAAAESPSSSERSRRCC